MNIKSDMKAFEITTTKSDYPFLVLAEGFMEAVGILQRQKNVWDGNIINVRLLDTYNSNQILVKDLIVAKESLEEKVRRELEPKLPRWKKMTNGAAGGDREKYLIRSSRGYYFTSACIGGQGYYLDMDELEQLPGIVNPNEV